MMTSDAEKGENDSKKKLLLFVILKNKSTANEVGKNGDERKDIVITQESQKIGIIKAKQIQIIIKKYKKIVAYPPPDIRK